MEEDPEFVVGQRVMIIKDLKSGYLDDIYISEDMANLRGQIFTIIKVTDYEAEYDDYDDCTYPEYYTYQLDARSKTIKEFPGEILREVKPWKEILGEK